MVNKIQLVLIFVCYWSLAHSLETLDRLKLNKDLQVIYLLLISLMLKRGKTRQMRSITAVVHDKHTISLTSTRTTLTLSWIQCIPPERLDTSSPSQARFKFPIRTRGMMQPRIRRITITNFYRLTVSQLPLFSVYFKERIEEEGHCNSLPIPIILLDSRYGWRQLQICDRSRWNFYRRLCRMS